MLVGLIPTEGGGREKGPLAAGGGTAAAATPRADDTGEGEGEGEDGAEALNTPVIALKETEVTLMALGHGMAMLRRTSTPWRVAALTAERDVWAIVPLVLVGYKLIQCVGLNWIALDADTAAMIRLPAAAMVAAELRVPMSDLAVVFTDSPSSPSSPLPGLAVRQVRFGVRRTRR